VGEAPGKVEDYFLKPFVGPAGKILRKAIADARSVVSIPRPRIYYTNLVQCRPVDAVGGNREPTVHEINLCRSQFLQVLDKSNPTVVVLLGRLAQKHLASVCKAAVCAWHPAYVLRRGGLGSSEYNELCGSLEEAFSKLPMKGSRHEEE
jgi:uracil-DNA glycosylase family 4